MTAVPRQDEAQVQRIELQQATETRDRLKQQKESVVERANQVRQPLHGDGCSVSLKSPLQHSS